MTCPHKARAKTRKEDKMSAERKRSNNEAAEFLGVKPNTLEIWRCKNIGPRYSKIGRRVLYDIADLQEFFESRRIETMESSSLKKTSEGK